MVPTNVNRVTGHAHGHGHPRVTNGKISQVMLLR